MFAAKVPEKDRTPWNSTLASELSDMWMEEKPIEWTEAKPARPKSWDTIRNSWASCEPTERSRRDQLAHGDLATEPTRTFSLGRSRLLPGGCGLRQLRAFRMLMNSATRHEWSRQVKTVNSIKQFAKRIGRSERHVQRLISDGEGPPVVALGKRAVGIIDDDGDAWIAARRRSLRAGTTRALPLNERANSSSRRTPAGGAACRVRPLPRV